ncbi:hypothetical protein ACEPPN_018674 [Leptodophora sp. 'Broadleaf-Isolate-01']
MSSPMEPKPSGSDSLTRNAHPQPNSQILRLPCEVRQMIITYAPPESKTIKYEVTRTHNQRVFTNSRLSISTIASLCLALYQDVKAIEHRFYVQNGFRLDDLYSGYFWLERLSPKNLAAIRTLSITLEMHTTAATWLSYSLISKLSPSTSPMEPVQEVRVTMSKALEMVREEKDIMLREENYVRVKRLERRIRVMIIFDVIYLTQFAERLGALMKLEIGERDLRTLEGPCAKDLI